MEWNSQSISPETWTKINLTNNYNEPIITATPEYSSTTNNYGIGVWITNVTSNSFMIKSSDENFGASDTITIHYIAIEKGAWTIPGSNIKVEANKLSTNKVGSSGTGNHQCPTYGETVSFTNSFDSNPLVISTRGTNNNPNSWGLTFQNHPSNQSNPVPTDQMCIGLSQSKTISPISITNNETIYWIAVDQGTGTLSNIEYEILWQLKDTGDSGGNWINGYPDGRPFTQSWTRTWTNTPDIIIGSQTSTAGSDGSWVVIYDTGDKNDIRMFVDEPNERAHSGSESGGGWAFDKSGNYGNILPQNNYINFSKSQIFFNENNTINAIITDINGNNTIISAISTIVNPNSTKQNISLIPQIINRTVITNNIENQTQNYTALTGGETIGETGEIELSNRTSKIITFTQTYNKTPIIIGIATTQNNDNSPFIPVIHSINKTHANISLCRDNGATTCDNNYLPENIHYAVFDIDKTNNYSWIEVGKINATTNGNTNSLSFNKTFTNTPYIFALPQTYNIGSSVTNGIAAHSWFTSPSTSGANIIGCDHPGTGDNCGGTAIEEFGYVAIDITNANFSKFAGGTQNIGNSDWTTINYGETYNNPRIFTMVNSESGPQDPAYPWAKSLTSSSADIRYCETDGANYCDTHNDEVTRWFAIENGPITIGNGGNDIEKNVTIKTYNNAFSQKTHNITMINININVTHYNNSGSSPRGNNNPDLELELSIGNDNWLNVGTLNITQKGIYSINITNKTILSAWQNAQNRDLKINGVYFDYYSEFQLDKIFWNLTKLNINYKTYTSNWSGVFTNTSICGQYNLTDLYSTDNKNSTNHTTYSNINFKIPCGPIIELLYPINNTKLLTLDKVNFSWHIQSPQTNLTCYLYLNSILNQTINCSSYVNNSLNIKLKSGYYNWTINATDEINNLSSIAKEENFLKILQINNSISKSITSINSNDMYKININIKNNLNSSRDMKTIDLVEKSFNYGSFNPIYNWSNITNNNLYNGTILGWNFLDNSNQTNNINYSITKNTANYNLLDEYIIGLE